MALAALQHGASGPSGSTTLNLASRAALACPSSWVIRSETFNSSIAAKCNRPRERRCSTLGFRCWRSAVWITAAGKARNSKGSSLLRVANRVWTCRHSFRLTPKNPRTAVQLRARKNMRKFSRLWDKPTEAQRAAWCAAACNVFRQPKLRKVLQLYWPFARSG